MYIGPIRTIKISRIDIKCKRHVDLFFIRPKYAVFTFAINMMNIKNA